MGASIKAGNATAVATLIQFGAADQFVTVKNNDASNPLSIAGLGDALVVAPGVEAILPVGPGGGGTLSLTSAGSVAFQAGITSGSEPIRFITPQNPAGAGTVTEAMLVPASSEGVLGVERTFVAVFDSAALDANGVANSTIAAHPLVGPILPDNAIVTWAAYEVETTFTSATDAGTVAMGVVTDAAAEIKAAVAISDGTNPYDTNASMFGTALTPATATGVRLGTTKTTGARRLLCTVAVEALTAGKLVIHGRYIVSAF